MKTFRVYYIDHSALEGVVTRSVDIDADYPEVSDRGTMSFFKGSGGYKQMVAAFSPGARFIQISKSAS